MNTATRNALRDTLRDRLQSIAEQAVLAQRLRPENDNLLDLIDDMDNDLQQVIHLVKRAREGGEA